MVEKHNDDIDEEVKIEEPIKKSRGRPPKEKKPRTEKQIANDKKNSERWTKFHNEKKAAKNIPNDKEEKSTPTEQKQKIEPEPKPEPETPKKTETKPKKKSKRTIILEESSSSSEEEIIVKSRRKSRKTPIVIQNERKPKKEISDYPNYLISQRGIVISFQRKYPRVLRPRPDGGGYFIVNLWENEKRKIHKIHRLVAEAFIPNPENKSCVDHIRNNPKNNNVNNLRWATKSENGMNTNKQKNCSSIYKGVSWSKKSNKWVTHIKINGKNKNLGYFVLEEDARDAYIKKAKEIQGEFYNDIQY